MPQRVKTKLHVNTTKLFPSGTPRRCSRRQRFKNHFTREEGRSRISTRRFYCVLLTSMLSGMQDGSNSLTILSRASGAKKGPGAKIMQIYVRLHPEKIHGASGNRSFVWCIIAARITPRARHRIEQLGPSSRRPSLSPPSLLPRTTF